VAGLADSGEAAIGFDLLFQQAREPADDFALAAALARAGNVVLAEAVIREFVRAADGRLLAVGWNRHGPARRLQAGREDRAAEDRSVACRRHRHAALRSSQCCRSGRLRQEREITVLDAEGVNVEPCFLPARQGSTQQTELKLCKNVTNTAINNLTSIGALGHTGVRLHPAECGDRCRGH
jgi:CHASE2 domain-containing sensor protein